MRFLPVYKFLSHSLSANAAWAAGGNVIYVAGRFCIILIVTKFFRSEEVGQLIFALAVATPISFLFNMEVRSVYVTDTRHEFNVGDGLALRVCSNAGFLIFLTVLVCVLNGLGYSLNARHILAAGAVRGVESWADLYLGVFQKQERMKYWAISQSLKTFSVLAGSWAVAHWRECSDPVSAVLWIWCAATVMIMLLFDRRWAKRWASVRLRWDRTAMASLIRFAFPLGIFVTVSILNSSVASYFIKSKMGDSSVAYFGVLLSYVTALTAVQNGINQSVLNRLAGYVAGNNPRFWKLLSVILAGAGAATAAVLLVVVWRGRWILRTFHQEEYAAYAGVFTLMIVAAGIILVGMVLGDAMMACRRFKSRMAAVGVGLAVNVIGCALLIPRYGLWGAGWAVLSSALSIAIVCGVVVVRAGPVIRVDNHQAEG